MERKIKPIPNPGLTDETNHYIELFGVVLLYVRIGELRIKIWGDVEVIVEDALFLAISYTDRFIRKKFPSERRVESFKYRPV